MTPRNSSRLSPNKEFRSYLVVPGAAAMEWVRMRSIALAILTWMRPHLLKAAGRCWPGLAVSIRALRRPGNSVLGMPTTLGCFS